MSVFHSPKLQRAIASLVSALCLVLPTNAQALQAPKIQYVASYICGPDLMVYELMSTTAGDKSQKSLGHIAAYRENRPPAPGHFTIPAGVEPMDIRFLNAQRQISRSPTENRYVEGKSKNFKIFIDLEFKHWGESYSIDLRPGKSHTPVYDCRPIARLISGFSVGN